MTPTMAAADRIAMQMADRIAARGRSYYEQHPFEELTPRQQRAVIGLDGVPRRPDDMVQILREELPGTDVATFGTHISGNRSIQILRIEGAWLSLTRLNGIDSLYTVDIPAELRWEYEQIAGEAATYAEHQDERDMARGIA